MLQRGDRRRLPGLRPQANTLIEVRWAALDGPVLASATSDKQGKSRVTLAPGAHYVVPVAKGDEQVVPDPVSVQPDNSAVAKPFVSVR